MYVTNSGSDTVFVIAIIEPIPSPPSPSPTPTGTIITSAVDGNNNPVGNGGPPNGGSTVSAYITFHVTATQGYILYLDSNVAWIAVHSNLVL